MFRAMLVVFFVAALGGGPAAGQLPGYQLIRLTETPLHEGQVSINNRRQIAFFAKEPFNNATMEIMLYDDESGETIQITDNSYQDLTPDLNDDGVLVWSAVMGQTPEGDPTAAIMVRTPDGEITQLTDGDLTYDRNPVINRHGQIAWVRWDRRGCSARNIMFFDGETIRRITDNDLTNQTLSLNDEGMMAWAEFDFCTGQGWRSLIKLYVDGEIITLSEPGLQSQSTTINNEAVVAWSFFDPQTLEGGIHVWQDGDRTLLTDWGRHPRLNERGDIALQRWHEESSTYQIWLYSRGRFLQASQETSVDNLVSAINDGRDLAWNRGSVPVDLIFLRRFDLGDLNCDGAVDAFDIEGFLLALLDPAEYANRYPDCDPDLADINGDNMVNAFDIERFIGLLFP